MQKVHQSRGRGQGGLCLRSVLMTSRMYCYIPQFLLSTQTPGGTGISEQIAELKRGAEIIVCTPGRMIDMLAANSGKVRLFDGAG